MSIYDCDMEQETELPEKDERKGGREDGAQVLNRIFQRLKAERREVIQWQLQKYEDNTFGYLDIDGDEHHKFQNNARVICTQGENEDREEFISKNGITFSENQYGSNEMLDVFINDESIRARREVARQGYGLDKLVYDSSDIVRKAVAEQGYGLDILIHDEWAHIRSAVARHGYGLDKLIDDEDYFVRMWVADQGYGLDILINDKYVCEVVNTYLKEHNLTLDQWKEQKRNMQKLL